MTVARIKLPPKLVPLFAPARGELRYRVAHGGRGSGKSYTFALMAALWGYAEPLRILCTRELQVSIKESFYAEVTSAIESLPWLAAHYQVGESFIRGKNGTEFIFRGLRHNIGAVKSMAQIDLCIVEEAADVPKHSWQGLLPTIRAPKSEFWVIYNPCNKSDPVDVMFRQAPPPRTKVVEVNWSDNPWFPQELDEQRQHAREFMDPADYAWIWEGKYLESSNAKVFAGRFVVDDFAPDKGWDGPYFGLDFGFAQDPTAGVKAWVHNRVLYIEHELYRNALELDHTAGELIEALPGVSEHDCRADNARPESISYLRRHGLPRMKPCAKGKGSVEDGVAHIKSYDRVVIHPRCKHVIDEFRLYSYKQDRLSGDVLPILEDANNHAIDALRYALEPVMKARGKGIFG